MSLLDEAIQTQNNNITLVVLTYVYRLTEVCKINIHFTIFRPSIFVRRVFVTAYMVIFYWNVGRVHGKCVNFLLEYIIYVGLSCWSMHINSSNSIDRTVSDFW